MKETKGVARARELMACCRWRSAHEALRPLLEAPDSPEEVFRVADECVDRGSLIAFSVCTGSHISERQFQIRVVSPDGRGERAVTSWVRTETWEPRLSPAWSPDGRRIAVNADRGVAVVEVDTPTESTLKPLWRPVRDPGRPQAGGCRDLVWSPDGRELAFRATARPEAYVKVQSEHVLFVVNVDGTKGRVMAEEAEEFDEPGWSPDGRYVQYVVPGVERSKICRRHRAGIGKKLCVQVDGRVASAAWSPDGRRIAFVAGPSLCVMNADGTERRVLVADPWAKKPGWSPDGTRIVFQSRTGVRVMTPEGKMLRQIPAKRFEGNPLASPDGRRLAFESGSRVWITNGSEERRLAACSDLKRFQMQNLGWSPLREDG